MTKILHADDHCKVVAFYMDGVLFWTTVYIYDDEGFVEKSIRIMKDGTNIIQ